MNVLWRGGLTTQIRIVSGLVLFTYAFFHFVNIGLGLFSPEAMERFQTWRQVITRSLPGTILFYGAALAHMGLAIARLITRRTLRIPPWEAVQIALGLSIPLLLLKHMVHTRGAHQMFGVNDDYGYIAVLIWGTADGAWQSLLLLIVWVHGCAGIHFWLRLTSWWRRALPWLIAVATLVPAFALAGFLTEGRRVQAAFREDAAPLMETFNWPSQAAFGTLTATADKMLWAFLAILGMTALVHVARKLSMGRKSVRIRYVGGPEVASPKGPTLLEMSRANGVPHTALCGGRGRCTTCRVIVEDGAALLHVPSEAEARSLRAVNAPPNARLACQIRPTDPLTVFRVFRPDGRQGRAHASQGTERRFAILFLDMRGFTARTTGQLPYDVVFLLNRFFDAIVPSITGAGGTVDKYLGDGLLAVFETGNEKDSARAALQAAAGIISALITFNRALVAEGEKPVAIGIGMHLGDVVMGEIGAAGNAPRTLIGDAVNTASRLEGRTKDLGVEVLVSQPLLQSAGIDTEGFEFLTLELRGVDKPLRALAVPHGAGLDTILNAPGR